MGGRAVWGKCGTFVKGERDGIGYLDVDSWVGRSSLLIV